MLHLHKILLVVFLLVSIFSCKKNANDGPGNTPKPVGVPTQVGVPDADMLVQEIIGAGGGDISSIDGRLKVIIPAGALAGDEEISVQTISNFNPLALGQAYRIEPHDVEFAKPITIEFEYSDEEIINTIPEALAIAYQDSNRVWQVRGGVAVDKNTKRVTVTTNHFSDWSLIESFHLMSSGTMVHVNGTVDLEVYTTEDLVIPLEPTDEIPMGNKISMTASYIKEWKLAGAGNLTSNTAKAKYTAPANVPSNPNPVAVSVNIDLKKRGKYLLVKHIEVVEDNGEIEVRVAGGAWVKKITSPAVKLSEGYYIIADADGDTQGSYVTVMWMGEEGLHAYKHPDSPTGTHVQYLVTNGDNYTCAYRPNPDGLVASGGGVTITSMGDDDGFIKGTFMVAPAGHGFDLRNATNVEGKFRVRKSW